VLETENGRITFEGSPEAICRANLWLRTAESVLLKVGSFNARSFEELFEKTKALPWSRGSLKTVLFLCRENQLNLNYPVCLIVRPLLKRL
jgi:23S rRNA G2445 N2-methylase RlmL